MFGNSGVKLKLTQCEWSYFDTEMLLVLKKCDARPAVRRSARANTQVISGKFLGTLLEATLWLLVIN
jgi:hypothetical protein